MPRQIEAEVVKKECLAPGIYRIKLESEYISGNVRPGQFVNIRCCDNSENLLLGVSISEVDIDSGTFDMVFIVKGIGTQYLADKMPGERLDLVGPLGNPFIIPEENSRVLIVGGGIGVFPLIFLAKQCNESYRSSLLGFRNIETSFLIDEFKGCSSETGLCSDDGTLGAKGFVTDLLEAELIQGGWDIIYSCGPEQMLKKVALLAEHYGTRCQVSLEQRMGCGIGACLVCSCKIKAITEKGWHYARVCKDGPVFWSNEIIWE